MLWNKKCENCGKRKPDVRGRSDWTPPMPLCDECYGKWWEANKDELG
jgi:hypothetical protein